MKILTRELSGREKLVLLIMILALLALMFYYFVAKPISNGISEARTAASDLSMQADILETRALQLEQISEELSSIKSGSVVSTLPDYNNENAEVEFLHDVLSTAEEYSIRFSAAEQDEGGALVRRPVSIEFTAADYATAENILGRLYGSSDRCIIMTVKTEAQGQKGVSAESVEISCSVVFYETNAAVSYGADTEEAEE